MHENPVNYAFKLSEKLGNKSSDPVEVVNFLKTIDSHKLIEAQSKIITKLVNIKKYNRKKL